MQTVSPDDAQQQKLVGILARCPLFRALKEDHFPQILKAGELVRYDAGETIIQQGSRAESFFVILEGEATISVEKSGAMRPSSGRFRIPTAWGRSGCS